MFFIIILLVTHFFYDVFNLLHSSPHSLCVFSYWKIKPWSDWAFHVYCERTSVSCNHICPEGLKNWKTYKRNHLWICYDALSVLYYRVSSESKSCVETTDLLAQSALIFSFNCQTWLTPGEWIIRNFLFYGLEIAAYVRFLVLHTSWFLLVLPLCLDYRPTSRLSVSLSIYMTVWSRSYVKCFHGGLISALHGVTQPGTKSYCNIQTVVVTQFWLLWFRTKWFCDSIYSWILYTVFLQ